MANTVLVGAQWGDEGKGKIIDFLTEDVDWVVRYQGGNNAGHTVEIGEEKYVLHLVPSGILTEGKKCVIGHGVVIDPLALLTELEGVEQRGIVTKDRFFISDRAHVVFPFHRVLDEAREARTESTDKKIGTTKRGIGPSYGDKVMRVGLRMGDLLDARFEELLAARMDEANKVLEALGGEALDVAAVTADYKAVAERLAPHITDTIPMLHGALARGEAILFEGAQGTMLDIDFGTYPYVTSSSATAGGACTGSGVPPHKIDRVVGVCKAYTTRVGEGPFPTELHDEMGEMIRAEGHEFGATTGRPRRCGWFDVVVARYAAMVNGIDQWALTKMDVLDKMPVIKICVAYMCNGKRMETVPANIRELSVCEPVYEEFPGWQQPTVDARTFEQLPEGAQAYIRRLEELTGVPVGTLSVGPKREATLHMGPGAEGRK